MAKPKNGSRAAPTLDDTVQELRGYAEDDRSVARERGGRRAPETREDQEDAALDDQRKVYERVTGKKAVARPAARRDLRQRDERAGDEDEEEPEEEERGSDDEETDLDDRASAGDEEGEADAAPSRRSKKSVAKALNALRRINAPAWVFEEDEDKILELAESMAGYQENADRAIQSREDLIRSLANGKGNTRAQAAEEPSESDATPSEKDLEEAAAGLARAMGVENDGEAKKALIQFARETRGKPKSDTQVRQLEGVVRDLMLDRARNVLRRNYPEHASDPESMKRLVKRMQLEASTGDYEGNYSGLIKESARIAFGPSKRERSDPERRSPARKPGAPAMAMRRERTTRKLSEGTEEHDRSIYDAVVRGDRRRLATRR